MGKTLKLTLNRKWFDMIASGEKKEEYREIKEWSVQRFLEIKEPLVFDLSGNQHDKITGAFWHCVGFTGSKLRAVERLLETVAEFKNYENVSSNNGYQKDCPNIKWEHKGIRVGEGKPEWGAEPGVVYFILEIGEILELNNYTLIK